MSTPLVAGPFRFASITVTITSGVAASLFGLLAALVYSLPERATPGFEIIGPVGFALGASSGTAVGLVWSKWMSSNALAYLGRRRAPVAGVLGLATLGGVLAGIVSTVILHAGLSVLRPLSIREANFIWTISLVLGTTYGAFVGIGGGIGWLVIMRRALRALTP